MLDPNSNRIEMELLCDKPKPSLFLSVPTQQDQEPEPQQENENFENEEAQVQDHTQDIPDLQFRDVIITKKFGASPYDSDR